MRKTLRVALCCAWIATAQTPASVDISRAHAAWNKFAVIANEWSHQHSDFTTSRADKERFKKVDAAWKEFRSLYKLVE